MYPDSDVPDWIPNLAVFRCAALLNIACYFITKAVILAHARSDHFARTGKRLFASESVPQDDQA